MKIAFTSAPGKGDTDQLLYKLANALTQKGYTPIGTVQINTDNARSGSCDMDVQVLPEGPVIRISQDLGRGAKGCRLIPEALEKAVSEVEKSLSNAPDVLIVNKFGRHEAEGRGFRTVIAEALSLDLPVLVGLNGLNREAFSSFSDDLAEEVPADLASLVDWCDGAIVKRSGL